MAPPALALAVVVLVFAVLLVMLMWRPAMVHAVRGGRGCEPFAAYDCGMDAGEWCTAIRPGPDFVEDPRFREVARRVREDATWERRDASEVPAVGVKRFIETTLLPRAIAAHRTDGGVGRYAVLGAWTQEGDGGAVQRGEEWARRVWLWDVMACFVRLGSHATCYRAVVQADLRSPYAEEWSFEVRAAQEVGALSEGVHELPDGVSPS